MTTNDDTTTDEESGDEATSDADDAGPTDDLPLTFADPPTTTFDDMAGLADEIALLETAVIDPLVDPGSVARTHGVLVHGPTGTGKSRLADALLGEFAANEFTLATFDAAAPTPDIVSKFQNSLDCLRNEGPSILVIDPLGPVMSNQFQAALKEELMALNAGDDQILVVGVVSPEERLGSMPGVFEFFEVNLEVSQPDSGRRQEFLQTELSQLCNDGRASLAAAAIDFQGLADDAAGLSMVQLESVCERAMHEAAAVVGKDDPLTVTEASVESAIHAVSKEAELTSSSRSTWRDGVIDPDVPDVSFDDIGGLDDVKETLTEYIEFPTRFADVYDAFDIPSGHGVLLHGPPGNGKTMLAKAVANEADRSFIAVSGPELNGKYVGQTEKRIREVFATAREQAPSVVFLDEFDAIAPDRNGLQRAYQVNFVNTLLSELDGLDANEDVLVVAATNRFDTIDPAVLRPGRIGDHIEIGAPDVDGAEAIVAATTRSHPLERDVTSEWIVNQLPEGFSGADIAAVCRDALHRAIHDASSVQVNILPDDVVVRREHYSAAVADRRHEAGSGGDIGFV